MLRGSAAPLIPLQLLIHSGEMKMPVQSRVQQHIGHEHGQPEAGEHQDHGGKGEPDQHHPIIDQLEQGCSRLLMGWQKNSTKQFRSSTLPGSSMHTSMGR